MAKIIKVKVILTPTNRWKRHAAIDAEKVEWIAWEWNGDPGGVETRGASFWIGIIHDDDLAQFAQDPSCIELNRSAAIALGNVWAPRIDRIHDVDLAGKILAKVHAGQPLSQTEKNAINPEHPQRGIHRDREFSARLDEVAAKKRFGNG